MNLARMNLGRACVNCTHQALIWGLTVVFVLLLLVTGILIRLYYKPYDLEEYMPAIHQLLYVENLGGIEFDNLSLSFDGRLNLVGEGVLVMGPERKMLATARALRLELSHLSLLKGVPAFRLLEFDGLGARFVVGDDVIQVGRYKIPRTGRAGEGVFNSFSAYVTESPALKYAEVINFRNTMARVTLKGDQESNSWDVKDTDLLFTRSRKLGAHAELTGLLKRDEAATSFYGSLEKPKGSATVRINTTIGVLESQLFAPLLPPEWRERLDARLKSVNLDIKLDEQLAVQEAQVATSFERAEVAFPELYPEPLRLRSANIGATYYAQSQRDIEVSDAEQEEGINPPRITIDDFVIEDQQGLLLSAQGGMTLPLASDALNVDTIFRLETASIEEVMHYLPPEQTQDLQEWLRKSTNYKTARLEGLTFNLKGNLRDFPFEHIKGDEGTGLMEVHFDYKNMDVLLHPNLPELEQVKGQAVLQGDVLRVVSPQGGDLAGQSLTDIDVIISDIINRDKPPLLRATGKVAGPADGVLPLVAKLFDVEPPLDEIEGSQTSTVDLVLPLKGKDDSDGSGRSDGADDDLQFSVKTEVTDTAFMLPHIDKPFNAEKMVAEVTDQQLTVKSDGHVRLLTGAEHPWPAQILWRENMEDVGAETYIEATLTTTDTPAPEVFSSLKTDIKGKLAHNITLQRSRQSPAWFNVTLESDLTPAEINVASFDWQKDAGDKGDISIEGRLHNNGRIFDMEMLLLSAPEAEIMGAAYLAFGDTMDIDDFALNLTPFRLGKTDASVVYQDEKFSLKGKAFNFTGIGEGELHGEMRLADGRYEVNLEELTFKGGKFYNMDGFLARDDGVWQEAHLNAEVGADKSDFTLMLTDGERREKEHKPPKHLEIYSADAGAAARALGVYSNLHKGKMEAFLKIDKEYSPFGFDAEGHALIENTFVRDAPAMMRLLSLVSLEQIMSANQGIAFEEMMFPLEMRDRTLFIKKGRMQGPNIAMRLAGSVDFAKQQIDMDGSLTPASGLNSVLGRIPILGRIITGTQGAVMVADFGVKGSTEEPEIWANPLSIVTPGILKDFFGGLFGSPTPTPENQAVQPEPSQKEEENYEENIFSP